VTDSASYTDRKCPDSGDLLNGAALPSMDGKGSFGSRVAKPQHRASVRTITTAFDPIVK